jgi:hypothetical protein
MKTLSLENVNANIILDLTKRTSKEITVGLPHSPEIALRPSSNNHRLVTGSSSAIAPMIAIIIGLGVIGFGGYTGYGMWQTKVQNDALREMEASEQKAIEEQAQQEKALLEQRRQEEAVLAEQQRLEAEAQYAQETPEVEFPQEDIAPGPAQQARQRDEITRQRNEIIRSYESSQRAKQTQNTPPEPTQQEKVSPEQEALKLFGNIMNNAIKNKGQ